MCSTILTKINILRGKYIFGSGKGPNIGLWTDTTASVQKNNIFMHRTFLQFRRFSKEISKIY